MGIHHSTVYKYHSQLLPDLQNCPMGCLTKLNKLSIRHGTRLLLTGKAETAAQVAKALGDITNQSISKSTVRNHLKKSGFKAVCQEEAYVDFKT